MSQFYDQASLVMVPSGYKSGKIYSQKPLSTSGELSFSRASNATRVNSSGLIEKVRENAFYKSTALITSSRFATYNSTPVSTGTYPVYSDSLAYSFPISGPNEGFIISVPSGSAVRSLSIYIKDFNTVDVYYTGTAPLNKISDAGTINGYNRYVVVFDGSANNFYFRPNNNNGTPTTVYATAPQIEDGDYPTAYISNDTTASVVSVGPVSGLPRLDYSGGASCPSLLLEPQRTNAQYFSERMDNTSYWSYSGGLSVSANQTTSPDGYTNADKIIVGANQYGELRGSSTSSAAGTYTASIFAKKGDINYILVQYDDNTNFGRKWFDLENGTAGTQAVIGWSIASSKIEDYGNGWYRCSISVTTTATSNNKITCFPVTADGAFGGANGQYIFVWGAQVEAGAYATSYIPTLSSAVTRVNDYTSKASSTIAADAKTWFCDANITEGNASPNVMFLTLRGGPYEGYFRYFDSNALSFQYYGAVGSVSIGLPNAIPAGTTQRVKMAARVEDNNIAFYVNGVQVGTETGATRGTGMNLLEIGTYGTGSQYCISDSINQVLLFPTALSNADLATLTTL